MFVPEAGAALEQVDDGECVRVFSNQDSVVIEGLLGTALAMAGLPLQDKASSCRCLCVFATRFSHEKLAHLQHISPTKIVTLAFLSRYLSVSPASCPPPCLGTCARAATSQAAAAAGKRAVALF